MIDSCYLCEIGKEGMIVPLNGNEIMVCSACLLDCIYRHPKLVGWYSQPTPWEKKRIAS